MDSDTDTPSLDESLNQAARFSETLPALSDNLSGDDLAPWRNRIDAIDRQLVRLLNERTAYAHVIGAIKHLIGMRAYVPTREAEVMENVIEANDGPFTDNAIRRIFEQIVEETRSLEQRTYEGKTE
ncbi:MAG: chorismate mutase [Longimonas sp.]|uniref:chorismate mutase n=1 Tax=Longimonas sp. TaxID=2039626 RepID=UPI0039747330